MRATHADYLELFLRIWANWEIRYMTGNVGWPVTSAMILALQFDASFKTKQYGSKAPPFNEIADHMRLLIDRDLQQELPLSAFAIKSVYLNPELKQAEIAFRNHISHRTLENRLSDGKLYLKGCIRRDPFFKDYL